MALPKISTPTYDVSIPYSNRKIKYRPMTVKEEKILLMAKQSEERIEQLSSIKQVVQNCIITEKVNVENIAFFETEYLFLKIRGVSVSNKTTAIFKDNQDEKQYTFNIDLDKVTLKAPSESPNTIDLGDGISITLFYPPTSIFTSSGIDTMGEDKAFESILMKCVDKIYQGEEIFSTKDSTPEELVEFINSIPSKAFEKIQEFFNSIPTLFYEIKYTNSMGTERTITLTTLDDFFTFG